MNWTEIIWLIVNGLLSLRLSGKIARESAKLRNHITMYYKAVLMEKSTSDE